MKEEDRLSALPDALIHHILSYIGTEQVVRTSILSNKWRYIWLSTPTLNFDTDNWLPINWVCYPNTKSVHTFMDFVDRVLSLRETTTTTITNFTLHAGVIDGPRLLNWILKALHLNVQHLSLNISLYSGPLHLPPLLFTSHVEVLKLSIVHPHLYYAYWVHLPDSICFALNIKNLELETVVFPQGDGKGELVLNFPVMETLRIAHSNVTSLKRLTINAPKLETLDLRSFCADNESVCEVNTITTNLESLVLVIDDSVWENIVYPMENLTSLVRGSIGLSPDEQYGSKERCFECFVKLLPKLCNVQALELDISCAQALADFPELLEGLPDFYNLKYASLAKWRNASSLYSILNFMEIFPRIETLICERYPYYECDSDSDDLEGEFVAKLPLKGIFCCLKIFEIRNFEGTEFELIFLEHLLEKAKHLKKMIIEPSVSFSSDERAKDLEEKLLSRSRASSSASISFRFHVPEDHLN